MGVVTAPDLFVSLPILSPFFTQPLRNLYDIAQRRCHTPGQRWRPASQALACRAMRGEYPAVHTITRLGLPRAPRVRQRQRVSADVGHGAPAFSLRQKAL